MFFKLHKWHQIAQRIANDISLEYENIERKGPPLNEELTKIFSKSDLKQPKLEKIENLLKMFYTQKILKV